MKHKIDKILVDVKEELNKLYRTRLKKILLYGSYARNEEMGGSDIDLLAVLDNLTSIDEEISSMSETLSILSLRYGVTISVLPIKEADYLHLHTSLLINIRKEGIEIA